MLSEEVYIMGWLSDLMKDFPLPPVAPEQRKDRLKRPKCRDGGNTPSPEGQNLPISDLENHRRQAQEGPGDIFVRAKGVLWKRDPSGGFHEKPYCPSCKMELNVFPPGSDNMLACPTCDFIAIFRPSKSKDILAQLNKTISEGTA